MTQTIMMIVTISRPDSQKQPVPPTNIMHVHNCTHDYCFKHRPFSLSYNCCFGLFSKVVNSINNTIQYNIIKQFVSRTVVDYLVESEARAVAGRITTLRVVREVRCVLSRRLNVSNVLDSLIAAGNSFQMVGGEKLKERLLKLVVQEGIHTRFWLAEWRQRDGW